MEYTKKPLTLAEQVARLKQRGLVFDDESEVTAYLFNISYYRLRAYTYPFQENGEDTGHNFTRKDIHFTDTSLVPEATSKSISRNYLNPIAVCSTSRIWASQSIGNLSPFGDKNRKLCVQFATQSFTLFPR